VRKAVAAILLIVLPAAVVLAGVWIFLPFAFFGPRAVKDACLSFFEKNETVRSGEAYGFRVGETKEQTFAAVRELFAEGEFSGLAPWADRDGYYRVYPHLFGYQPPEKFVEVFADWDSWKIRGFSDGETKEVQLFFTGPDNDLRQIDRTRETSAGWPTEYPDAWPEKDGLPAVRRGMSPRETFAVLVRLAEHPGYEGMEMAPLYLAWRSIKHLTPEELERILPFDEWYMRKSETPFTTDSIHLGFTDGRLTEIGRYRSYDPFPM